LQFYNFNSKDTAYQYNTPKKFFKYFLLKRLQFDKNVLTLRPTRRTEKDKGNIGVGLLLNQN